MRQSSASYSPPRRPNARQCGRLYTLASRAGLSHAEAKAELQARYHVGSTKHLNMFQYEAYCADLSRRQMPDQGLPRIGAYASSAHLAEFVRGLQQFGTLWRGEMTDDDVQVLTILFNDWRLYRPRDRRLSQRQVDGIVKRLARFPIAIFRAASYEWMTSYRTGYDEAYFIGICKTLQRRAALRAAGLQGNLELV